VVQTHRPLTLNPKEPRSTHTPLRTTETVDNTGL
jgi:hypothetical protein